MTVTSKRRLILTLIVLATFMFTACETTGPKTVIGGLGGAAAGGLIGAAAGGGGAGIAAGTLLGGLLGGVIGDRLDAADRRHESQTAQQALESAPTGTRMTWRNPDSGHSGTIMPTRTYQTADNTHCREYQQTVTVGGETQQAYGTACRQPAGSWKIVR